MEKYPEEHPKRSCYSMLVRLSNRHQIYESSRPISRVASSIHSIACQVFIVSLKKRCTSGRLTVAAGGQSIESGVGSYFVLAQDSLDATLCPLALNAVTT